MTQSVYIDLETTGLDAQADHIIEIGIALVENFTVVDMFQSVVVDPQVHYLMEFDMLDDFIKNMHGPDGSGILKQLEEAWNKSPGSFHPQTIEKRAIEAVQHWNLGRVPVYGSSVHFDRRFMSAQMPDLDALFHYRCVDSSSQMEFIKAHHPKLAKAINDDPTSADSGNHDVISDIFFSVDLQRRIDKWSYRVANQAVELFPDEPDPVDLFEMLA